jgi:signal transduction histidine kinase
MRRLFPVSLLWRTLLSTSIAVTILFAITGWIVQDNAIRATSLSLDEEVRTSFHAYDSLWRSQAAMLASVSLVLSNMSDVRAAFGTGDEATIRDTAAELWNKISRQDAIFLVADPRGKVIASLGGELTPALTVDLPIVRAAAASFPRQASGFMTAGSGLYQIAVTPVYVQTGNGPAGLLNVLVAGYAVNDAVAGRLKDSTGGSEFVFDTDGKTIASTLGPAAIATIHAAPAPAGQPDRVESGGVEYRMLSTPLLDLRGRPVGELHILRSFEAARQHITALRQSIVRIWLIGVLVSIALTYGLARRVLGPISELDRGATEVARGNYEYRVPVASSDELGRLGQAFNAMSASVQDARQELIRRERISTIGRLSSSIVHDLRNPLAAIYGGAEMLIDSDLSPTQVQRLAGNIYRSSRRVQELLQDLVDVGRGKTLPSEICRLNEIVAAAYEPHVAAAEEHAVKVNIDVPENIELPLERARMERVFSNLIDNAISAMAAGGSLEIAAEANDENVVVKVRDSGPGIAPDLRTRLFQPFVSFGKKNGVGLGLALSRQTVLDHGGELSLDPALTAGACFVLKLPLQHSRQL